MEDQLEYTEVHMNAGSENERQQFHELDFDMTVQMQK